MMAHASLVVSKQALELLEARAAEVKRGPRTTGAAGSPEESAAEGKEK